MAISINKFKYTYTQNRTHMKQTHLMNQQQQQYEDDLFWLTFGVEFGLILGGDL